MAGDTYPTEVDVTEAGIEASAAALEDSDDADEKFLEYEEASRHYANDTEDAEAGV